MPTSFPLLNLPPDILIIILGKCSITSLHRLIHLHPHLHSLFLTYPESILQDALDQYPRQLSNLILASLVIYRAPTFNLASTLSLLQGNVDVKTTGTIVELGYDPVRVLDDLYDFHGDISNAVWDYADVIYARACQFENPLSNPPPARLSETEYTRIASTFWLLRIYAQLSVALDGFDQRSVESAASDGNEDWVIEFLGCLRPWQVDMMLAVHRQIECWSERSDPQYVDCDRWAFLPRGVPGASLGKDPPAFIVGYWRALGGDRALSFPAAIREYVDTGRWLRDYRVCRPADDDLNDGISIPPSPGYDYFIALYENSATWPAFPVSVTYSLTPLTYRRLFQDLGTLFWDEEILHRIDFLHPSTFNFLTAYVQFCDGLRMQRWRGRNLETGEYPPKWRRIVSWTRAMVGCTFEEWELQELGGRAVERAQQVRKSVERHAEMEREEIEGRYGFGELEAVSHAHCCFIV